jgi:glutathione synthase
VTSPTGLKTYYDLTGVDIAKIFWKGLKAWIIWLINKRGLC